MDDTAARLHMQVPDGGDVAIVLERIGKLEHRQLSLAATDDVDPRSIDHLGRIRRMRAADDDRNIDMLFQRDDERFDRMVHACQSGERDESRIVAPDGPNQVWRVGDEQQIGLVPVSFQNTRQVRDTDGLLNAVVLDEQHFHMTSSAERLRALSPRESSVRPRYGVAHGRTGNRRTRLQLSDEAKRWSARGTERRERRFG